MPSLNGNNMNDLQKQTIEEALSLAVDEGVLTPEKVRSWTDDEKIDWYEKEMDFDRDESGREQSF